MIAVIERREKGSKYKFGIRIPNSVPEALKLDEINGDMLWHEAIQKEMTNVQIAFQIVDQHKVPPAYLKIPMCMIFDVKLNLQRKACLVAGGHITQPPSSMTYSLAVSRDSVCILLLHTALKGLTILMTNIGNAYLN